MKVADLQHYFTALATLLHSTDGKKSAAELAKIAEALQPFRDHDLAVFGGFLARAEEYDRTGSIPVYSLTGTPKRKPTIKPAVDISAIRDEVKRLYGSASSPTVTIESIEELRPKLDPLKKPELLAVAEAINLVGLKNKSVADVKNAIIARVTSIKQSAIKNSIIDRPGTQY